MKDKNGKLITGSLISLAVFFIFIYLSRINYVLFHSLAEVVVSLVGLTFMILAYITRNISDNNYYTFIGISYGFVAFINLFHLFTYKGVSIIDVTSNVPTQLWIIQRYFEAVVILTSFQFMNKKVNVKKLLIVNSIVTLLLLLSVFTYKVFPECYIEGQGLTAFKVVSEYVIGLMFIISIFLYIKNINDKKIKDKAYLLIISLIFKVFSGLALVIYIGVYDISNFLGHIFNFISYILLYAAFIDSIIKNPYNVLFQEINEKMNCLKKSNEKLEQEKIALEYDYKKYEELLRLMPHGILIMHKERIVYYNEYIKNLLEAENYNVLLNRSIYEIIDVTCHNRLRESLPKLEKGDYLKKESCLLIRNRKKYPVEISVYSVKEKGIPYYIFLIETQKL
ncbi:MASE3 domain-containing protein [Clostridium polynesiense]|uniref:MASE3 domain-containing protein n=1 Tax=Clostridium polynesiense TaxID=1325933 RepID=UPI00164D31A6|nr:MASE3 domain-containing protein [Clostridium polynesiense]